MSIRAIICDVYGTLIEVGPACADADSRWLELHLSTFGKPCTFSRLDFAIACNRVIAQHHEQARRLGVAWPEILWPSIVAEVLPPLRQLSTPQRDEFLFHQIQLGHTTRMNPEVAQALRWIVQHQIALGIASNAQAYTLRELERGLRSHDLDPSVFAEQLSFWSFQHGFSKPDPHVFRILSTRLLTLGIPPQEALMVGDRLDNDVEPAQRQGWQAWHLTAAPSSDWSALLTWLKTQQYPPQSPA